MSYDVVGHNDFLNQEYDPPVQPMPLIYEMLGLIPSTTKKNIPIYGSKLFIILQNYELKS